MNLPLPTLFLDLLDENYSRDHVDLVFKTILNEITIRSGQHNVVPEELIALWDVAKEFFPTFKFCMGGDTKFNLQTTQYSETKNL